MHSNGTKIAVTVKGSLPSPQNTSPSDSESEVLLELERRRKQVEEEISHFREQKEKEFRDFEQELQACRRRKSSVSSPTEARKSTRMLDNKPPSRTSSSSALNLLAGRGASKQSQSNTTSKLKVETLSQRNASAKAGPSLSQPVASLDTLNIKGEHAPLPARPQTPPTPTSLPRNLPRSSSGSSVFTSKLRVEQQSSPLEGKKAVSPDDDKHRNSFTGLFTPSYLPLLDANSSADDQSSSALITPPAEDEAATAPSSYKKNPLTEVIVITSSSFPPHVTLSPGGHIHSSKRAYTAPTVPSARKPSALRTASGGAIERKPKHVTFRLADSAIVEPSSSYEEGPSPQFEDGNSQSSKSGARSPLRISKSQLYRTLSPDEEDAEAGVKPGMGMGDVIQKLNDFTVAEAAKHGEKLVLEVEDKPADDSDTEDNDDDDDDLPMVMPTSHQDNLEDDSDRHFDVEYHEHEDEAQSGSIVIAEDGYFSPKSKHISTIPSRIGGHSPIAPYRNEDWSELSSSDKDRLLFEARRHSDDSDDLNKRIKKIVPALSVEGGFTGGLRHSVDGGSGVGFFELDEELASPEAGQARPFEFDNDADDVEAVDEDEDEDDKTAATTGLGLLNISAEKGPAAAQRKRWSNESASKFGVGSVPIDIVRPSLSVSSSWVGTFGH